MNWWSWLLWGFASTLVLTVMMSGSQRAGLTRMSIPYLLGTMVTPDRDRAKLWGFGIHLMNGWAFALLYIAVFHALGTVQWWLGALMGLLHAAVVLTVLMPMMPAVHPRMPREAHGPSVTRQLEPPGFAGLHYGIQTPLIVVLAHIVFGTMLGLLYTGHGL